MNHLVLFVLRKEKPEKYFNFAYGLLYSHCYYHPYCCQQAVIDANIFPVLIDILGRADFKTRKEAAWAITNATSGGSPEQIRYVHVWTIFSGAEIILGYCCQGLYLLNV